MSMRGMYIYNTVWKQFRAAECEAMHCSPHQSGLVLHNFHYSTANGNRAYAMLFAT